MRVELCQIFGPVGSVCIQQLNLDGHCNHTLHFFLLLSSAQENILVPGHALFCQNVPAGIFGHRLVILLHKVVLIYGRTLSIKYVVI